LCTTQASEKIVARVEVKESQGIERPLEYVEIAFQMPLDKAIEEFHFIARQEKDGQNIPCQIVEHTIFKIPPIIQFRLIFPVSIKANETHTYKIKYVEDNLLAGSNLHLSGEGLNLVVDNTFYRADLTKSNQSEAKSHESGQLRELLIKRGFDVLLRRTENRMHWAPNFQNQQVEYYKTIAGWEHPENYKIMSGPYLIRTFRSDRAPEHSEILLSAKYSFYDELPYFTFFSSMVFKDSLVLVLLRNDEMTMDSLFTHLAYQKKPGKIVDVSFKERYNILESEPISNTADWLCFYNLEKGYGFGSIRIRYNITDNQGRPSPTYLPYTKISDGAAGGKYWNRRLINDHPILVPAGSRYVEENAYIVFKIDKDNKFSEIEKWADIIQHPLETYVYPLN